jgi:peptidoglycan hydrolase-like protein with peptidoglycan-binding domain
MLYRDRRSRRTLLFTLLLLLCPLAAPLVAAGPSNVAGSPTTTDAVVAKRGDRSPTVRQLQQLLIANGVAVRGGADGIFGPGTETAVKEYQQRRGLTVNGVADTPTATLLGLLPATPLLAKGAHGTAVTVVQQQLIAVGVTVKGGADGWYGSGTTAAVSAFQGRASVPVTGNVDAATAAILANAAARVAVVPTTLQPTTTQPTTTQPPTTVPASTSSTVPPPVTDSIIFPMPPTCKFWDTWGAPRSGGRKHQGVDIMANSGTPLYAVRTGTITKKQVAYAGSLAGNALWLTTADGTYYFYAHLSAFADGVGVGSRVAAGTVIGYVGKTGNAGVAHLHFEVHPKGGAAVNPYPIVKAVSGC